MVEELYIIHNGERLNVDLAIPSGITLNFKSNIFGDLSKIIASYSYTFKLPMTVNNRRVLDLADDIRTKSRMIRKRIKAEFYQNGVKLFDNANLYIESVDTAYNAVLTWDVVDGFNVLKDNDCSIKDLPHEETIITFGNSNEQSVCEESNNSEYVYPEYSCGLPYRKMEFVTYEGWRDGSKYHEYIADSDVAVRGVEYYSPYPFPVVPIKKLIDMINQKFGVSIRLGSEFQYSQMLSGYDKRDRYDLINRGVVPCIDKLLTYDEQEAMAVTFSLFGYVNDVNITSSDSSSSHIVASDGTENIKSLLTFTTVNGNADGMIGALGASPHYKFYVNIDVKLNIFGYFVCKFENFHINTGGLSGGRGSSSSASSSSDSCPVLTLYEQRRTSAGQRITYSVVELAKIEGVQVDTDSNGYYVYEFDFKQFEGTDELTASNFQGTEYSPLFFAFNDDLISLSSNGNVVTLIPDVSDSMNWHPMDVYYNLPDITCMNFVKALFFMLGAYPTGDEGGNIVPVFYDVFIENMSRAKDWSSKIYSSPESLPTKIDFKVGDVAQNNLYIMKSDDLDKDDDEKRDDTDVYASGVGVLKCINEVLDLSKTVIQLPFNAPYILNKKTPKYDTGSTFKAYEYKNKSFTFKAPAPIVGLIDRDKVKHVHKSQDGAVISTDYTDRWTMTCWNGFAELEDNASFAYLQRILNNPFMITEYVNLNEFDLRDIDYSVPVFIEKYNSYFAIVSIARDSQGKCKCELIKLP